MGRIPCCEPASIRRGPWTPEEDDKLIFYITHYGTRDWRLIPKNAGLQRCAKTCRLRWTNYLQQDLKRGKFTDAEEQTIIKLHAVFGSNWSVIAAKLPGRTNNDVRNLWNTKLKKKLYEMGIDPVTHRSFSDLRAMIARLASATTRAPPAAAHLAEAAPRCVKDEIVCTTTTKTTEAAKSSDGPRPRKPNSKYAGREWVA